MRDQGEGLRSAAKPVAEFPDISGGVTPGARERTERVAGVRVSVKRFDLSSMPSTGAEMVMAAPFSGPLSVKALFSMRL